MEIVTSIATCIMIYALTSAKPLKIIGLKGLVLAFVTTLFDLVKSISLLLLLLYTLTRLWTSRIWGLLVLTSGSYLVKYLTRYTEKIFSVLISVIFSVEACMGVSQTLPWNW